MNTNYVFPKAVFLPLYFSILLRMYKLLLGGTLENFVSLMFPDPFLPGHPVTMFAFPAYFLLLILLGFDWGGTDTVSKSFLTTFPPHHFLGSSSSHRFSPYHTPTCYQSLQSSEELRTRSPGIVGRPWEGEKLARSGAEFLEGKRCVPKTPFKISQWQRVPCLTDLLWRVWKDDSFDNVIVVTTKTLVQISSAQVKGRHGCLSMGRFLGLARPTDQWAVVGACSSVPGCPDEKLLHRNCIN